MRMEMGGYLSERWTASWVNSISWTLWRSSSSTWSRRWTPMKMSTSISKNSLRWIRRTYWMSFVRTWTTSETPSPSRCGAERLHLRRRATWAAWESRLPLKVITCINVDGNGIIHSTLTLAMIAIMEVPKIKYNMCYLYSLPTTIKCNPNDWPKFITSNSFNYSSPIFILNHFFWRLWNNQESNVPSVLTNVDRLVRTGLQVVQDTIESHFYNLVIDTIYKIY